TKGRPAHLDKVGAGSRPRRGRAAAAGHVGDWYRRHDRDPASVGRRYPAGRQVSALWDIARGRVERASPPRADSLCDPADRAAQPPPVLTTRPLIGVFAVLLGQIIATLDSRITNFGLADVRGAVHAGFDEGAWITTAFTVGQMLIGPVSVWLGLVFGPRRLLLISSTVFTLSNLLLPFSSGLPLVLAFQLIRGLASGTFIPLTLAFVVGNLPTRWVIYGIGAYAMNLELSLNIAASIEGWFSDYWSWKWIFWDTALLAPVMMICIYFGMPRRPVNRELLRTADWAGILYASVGFSLLYAALDQGNRLDWLNSGLINALLMGGGLLLVAFVVHELTHDRPWVNLSFAVRGNFPLLLLFLSFFRFAILSTSYIIPLYLTTIQNYRATETGGVLFWIALPQFLLAPVVCNDPALRRRTVADGLRLCARRLRLLHGWPTHPRLGRRRLLALADRAGGGTVIWTDVASLVQRPAPEAKRDSHLRRDVADCAPVRWTTRRGFRSDFHTGARADLLEPHRTSCNHRFAVHRPAPAGLCTRRDRTLDRPSRGQCARDCAPRPFRAKPSQRAGLYRQLHDHRVRRDWRFIADAASAHPAGKPCLAGRRGRRSLIMLRRPCRHQAGTRSLSGQPPG